MYALCQHYYDMPPDLTDLNVRSKIYFLCLKFKLSLKSV